MSGPVWNVMKIICALFLKIAFSGIENNIITGYIFRKAHLCYRKNARI